MSRALNIDATQPHVTAACAKLGAAVTVIEVLPGGCTRVVLRNGDDAARVRRHYGAKVIEAAVARTPLAIVGTGRLRDVDASPRPADRGHEAMAQPRFRL